MTNRNVVAPWVRRFLLEHVVAELNLSRHTQASYRDALALFLPFAAKAQRRAVDHLEVEHLSPDIVRAFLAHLEETRRCSVTTRNQRLAAIHSFARFVGARSPEHLQWCAQLAAVPFKKASKGTLPYLDKSEMDAILAAPNRRSHQGIRDHALLLFLYNSGARCDEAARLIVADLDLGTSPAVKILGKGNKVRLCPLWPATANTLRALTDGRDTQDRVFRNRRGAPITRFGIYAMVSRYARQATQGVPSLGAKRVSPHVIRHTTAVHLLRAGVDINTIRAWLGHVSLDTTNVYAEVDLEMKAKALSTCEIPEARATQSWHRQVGLLAFLKELQRAT
ncbi:MAG: tyrosine-type recombinase/integrase [Gemmatimonadaceae bacterium]|nr:tyrosine-type recombinase/integrase [Gemmatimonadaceae bacterium]